MKSALALALGVFVLCAPASASQTQRQKPTKKPTQSPAKPLLPLAPKSDRPELVIQSGHSDNIRAVVFSPDGKLVASASSDKTIRLWEFETGRMLRLLDHHRDNVTSIAFSPDGKTIASGSLDKTVAICDVKSGRVLRSLNGHEDEVNSVSFSPDGKAIASGSRDQTINIWDPATGDIILTVDNPSSEVRTLTFGPNGKLLAAAGADKKVRLWDLGSDYQTATLLRTFEGSSISRSLAFTPDGRTLASAGEDNSIVLFSLETGGINRTLRGHNGIVTSVLFSRDGSLLFSGSYDKTVRAWDVRTGQTAHVMEGAKAAIASMSLSPDGKTIAASSWTSILLWDTTTGNWARNLESRLENVRAVAFSPDGKSLAAAGGNKVNLWDRESGGLANVMEGQSALVTTIAYSANAKFFASAGTDNNIRLWDLSRKRLIRNLIGHSATVTTLAFSPDNKLLASGSVDRTIRLWDLQTGRSVARLEGHVTLISAIAFAPNGNVIASGSYDNLIKLWDVANGKVINTLTGHISEVTGVAFSPDGAMLASCSRDKTIKIWDPSSGQLIRTLEGNASDVLTVAFNNDGRLLASGGYDKTIRLWDARTGKQIRILEGHTSPVVSITFGPNGRFIFSGSEDASAKIWSVDDSQPLCTLLSFNSGTEWLTISADGLFDGSPDAWKTILWRFAANTFDVAPVEAFFNEYYYPGLLGDILAGKRPRAAQNIAQADRRQPQVSISLADNRTRAGQAISSRKIKIRVQVSEAPMDSSHTSGSGARDVRLFRNGSLIKVWRGDVLSTENGGNLEETISVVAGENRLTAYAFNRDNIKSADATLVVKGADSLKRKGIAYVIIAGINEYANSGFNLRYAVADAQEFGSVLIQEQTKLGNFSKVELIPLLNKDATRANILDALGRLAGREPAQSSAPEILNRIKPAEPEDAVIVYFAGHGTAQKARFYLIPHDLGYDGPIDGLDQAGLNTLLSHSISDRELQNAFEHIDATDLLMVIDACNSGQALESDEKRRGPMNSKGLAQLAYEKGLYILTAAQGYQAALEAAELGHGFLTYALVEEGLKNGAADSEPKDGKILIREWVDYAVNRVPEMQESVLQGARGLKIAFVPGDEKVADPSKRSVQRPRVFYRREVEPAPFVVETLGGRNQ